MLSNGITRISCFLHKNLCEIPGWRFNRLYPNLASSGNITISALRVPRQVQSSPFMNHKNSPFYLSYPIVILRSIHVLLVDFAGFCSLLLFSVSYWLLYGIAHNGRHRWQHLLLRKSVEAGGREQYLYQSGQVFRWYLVSCLAIPITSLTYVLSCSTGMSASVDIFFAMNVNSRIEYYSSSKCFNFWWSVSGNPVRW